MRSYEENYKIVTEMRDSRSVGRLIVFIELVHGCENKDCPSFKKGLCKYDGLSIMSMDTLRNVILEIHKAKEELKTFKEVVIWPYGCGDSMQHPQFELCIQALYEAFPQYPISVSVDSHAFKYIPGSWNDVCKVKVMHKLPKGDTWLPDALKWNGSYKNISHGFILDEITVKFLESLKKLPLSQLKKGRSFHIVDFGADNPDRCQKTPIMIDPDVRLTTKIYDGYLAKRTMFSYDGSVRRCLVAGTGYKTFEALVKDDLDFCCRCFAKSAGDLIIFNEDGSIILEEFGCCVSHAPL